MQHGQDESEGVIKFKITHRIEPLPTGILSARAVDDLLSLRQKLYEKRLIGCDSDGIGYGNVSRRIESGFLITGSQTGCLPGLSADHLCLVQSWDIAQNSLCCIGQLPASSESLTHAAIYDALKSVQCVIHVHHSGIWHHFKGKIPTADVKIPYGTPQMAQEIAHIVNENGLNDVNSIVMAGHKDGIITYGVSAQKALDALLSLLNQTLI